MADNLDLTLPPSAPAAYLSQDRQSEGLPVALYTLIPLSEDELHEVARACESDLEVEEGEVVRPAPNPRFVSRPLQAVYDSHLQLGSQGEYDGIYFIVVTDKNWKESGVLLVTLEKYDEDDEDDESPLIDSFFCRPEGAGSTIVNLQIANMDWEDCREGFEVGNDGEEEEEEEEEEGKDDDEKEEEVVELPTGADEGQSDDEGPEYPSKKPAYDYLVPIYILESVDADTVISSLEEDSDDKPDSFADYRIRNQGSLKPTVESNKDIKTLSRPDPVITNDLIAQACALHPVRCRANKWLNKTYFLVCDNTQPSKSGLVLVKLAWDGVTKGRSKAELRAIGNSSSHETIRLPGTCESGITYGYVMIADDLSIFSRTHPAFAMFLLNADLPFHVAKTVDKKHWDRKQGDHYFVVAWESVELHPSSSPTVENKDMRWTLEEAVNRFPWFCYANRFEPLFNRQYFIWFDHETVKDEGVVLVRYDWDGDIEKTEEELWDFKELDAVRTIRVPAKDAMAKILTAAKDGSDDWAWEAYRA